MFAHRSRPCMLAQIGLHGVLRGQISEADYAADEEAAMFLRSQQDEVTHELNAQMEACR